MSVGQPSSVLEPETSPPEILDLKHGGSQPYGWR
jgi:hypothetical protein